MATTLGKRISRSVENALLARDRAEMRAVDALLALVEKPLRKRPHAKASRGKTQGVRRRQVRAVKRQNRSR
jgi:hypothetical protein